jgi:hypothetical protein
MLSDCLWGVYQMIGKLNPRVYLLHVHRRHSALTFWAAAFTQEL